MEGFTLNVARSFIGRNVNLYLKDGSVIVNVQLAEIHKDLPKREALIKCVPYGNENQFEVPLKNIARAKLLDLHLIKAHG